MSLSTYTGDDSTELIESKPVPIYHQNSKGPNVEQAFLDPATMTILEALRLQQAALEQQILLMQAGQTTQLPTTTSIGPIPDMPVANSTNELARMVEEEELIENDQSENVIRNIKKEFDSTPHIATSGIFEGASFHSFAEFASVFDAWKEANFHPMRIASSDALKDPDGNIHEKFRYKCAVFHCVHYGKPRKRGSGARLNQTYLPCGCPVQLRITYDYADQVLRISSMNTEHRGHPITEEHYNTIMRGRRKSGIKRRLTGNSLSSNDPSTSSSNTSVPMSSPSTSSEFSVKMEPNDPFEFQEGSLLVAEEDSRSSPARKTRLDANSIINEIQSPIPQDDEYYEATIDVPALSGLAKIESGAEFKNWNDFETAFEHWKSVGKHPMRIASSLTLKDLVGNQNTVYRYKSIVYQCAHYGIGRHRGFGARPNQNYLPCGCRSMLRLCYDYQKQTLKIYKMVEEHKGHPRDRKYFERISARARQSKGSRPSFGASVDQKSGNETGPALVQNGNSMEQIISVFLQQQKATHDFLSNCQRNNPGSLDISKLFGMNIPDLSKIAALGLDASLPPQTVEHIVKLEVDRNM